MSRCLNRAWSSSRADASPAIFARKLTEGITYFDQFRNGWLLLYTRQRVPEGRQAPSFLHQTDVCIQLPGVLMDAAPSLDLCRYTGNEWADFGTILESRSEIKRLKKPIKLEVVGTMVRTDEDRDADRWIVGLIARNPYHRKKKLPRELEMQGFPSHDLLEMELILCDLKDHHQEGDEVDHYVLQGVETTDAHYVPNVGESIKDGDWRSASGICAILLL